MHAYHAAADLGYQMSEAYGISYKARGLCADSSNQDIFDKGNGLDYGTEGDIVESNLHHNVSEKKTHLVRSLPKKVKN